MMGRSVADEERADSEQGGDRGRVRQMLGLLVLAAGVGLVVSLAAWCLLEGIHELQVLLFTDLPEWLGYSSTPAWLYLVILGVGGFAAALAIVRLPGEGGHVPAHGLQIGGAPILPIQLPSIVLAALATIGFGLVLGPEAPLIALGAGLGMFAIRRLRGDAPDEAQAVVAACGSFAAMSLLFQSPIIAAVILIEALGLDREKLPLVLLPGLTAAGIGSLVSLGMGSLTGLSTSAYALGTLTLPAFARPDVSDFAWTVPLAILVAAGCFAAMRIGIFTLGFARRRPLLVLPAVGVVIAALAILFHAISGEPTAEVLFSGQDALPGLVENAGGWSIGALLLLMLLKTLAWGLSLGSFRGGPTFPALFLGAAAGVAASHLPGFSLSAAVAVGMGVGVVAVLRLPLSAVVLATLLAGTGVAGTGPLIIVGVVIGYLTVTVLDRVVPAEKSAPPPAAATSA